jgi:hypothetical protein
MIEPSRGIGLGGRGSVVLCGMSLLFVFFYLPGRFLFFVEDARPPLTWVQSWLAMLPVVWLAWSVEWRTAEP